MRQSGARTEATAPLSLQKAIALALEANLDLTVAQQEVEAVQGRCFRRKRAATPNWRIKRETSAAKPAPKAPDQPAHQVGGKRAAHAASRRGRGVAVEVDARRVDSAAVVAAFFQMRWQPRIARPWPRTALTWPGKRRTPLPSA